ncbi:ethanolamine ammonia-lyase, small subunit (light chain) [Bradyrhizobium sp. STM 3843]|nr:ethanolamine ammonia-lyase, small subunit (light chain) [Bradyrhizobium sp. STM 3843]
MTEPVSTPDKPGSVTPASEPSPGKPLSLADLRALTPARLALGRAGASMPTRPWLEFTLDHARARDAVHAAFDPAPIVEGLSQLDLATLTVASRAANRRDYLSRPDLGRRLDSLSAQRLASAEQGRDVVIVIGDGLSPKGVHAHATPLVRALLPRLAAAEIAVGPVVIASGARVALGDEIGELLGARLVAMLIGERPGLSAPDSLGAYLTFAPRIGRSDAERNCVSNIHRAGLSYDEAAAKIAWLAREGLKLQLTGVALKDESDGTPQLPV